MSSEPIKALNQILGIIDNKASRFKDEIKSLSHAQRLAERKLLLDLIDDGVRLCHSIKPTPTDAIYDLNKLAKQLGDMTL